MVAVTFPGLNETERQLWQAFPHGTWVDLRTGDAAADDLASAARWGPDRIVRAEVITALLLGAGEVEAGYAPAVRLRGARITGRLDLMGATVSHPLCLRALLLGRGASFRRILNEDRTIHKQLPASV
jgi:hypothetical protein